jgi:isopenicillin-N epimerase
MVTFGRALRSLWALEKDMCFLNHGAFGATPIELQEVQAGWRRLMEANPPRFFIEELPGLLREAAEPLAGFVGVEAERLAFVENASSGTAAVLRSLCFTAGDEILTTDHVYNAVRNALRHVANTTGAVVIEAPVGMPVAEPDQVLDALRGRLSPRTRLIVIDHVASASAVIMPVEAVVALGRALGIPVLVDGAHAPGMLNLALDRLGADFYVGNCHKWLCAPKGAAFLAVAPDWAGRVHPTVISHAYGQGFTAEFGKVGSRDPSSWLTVPAALAFRERLGAEDLRRRNQVLARHAAERLARDLDTELGAPPELFGSMATVRLPTDLPADRTAAAHFHDTLWSRHRIEVPVMPLAGALWLRLSAQAYNDEADYELLASALAPLLRDSARTIAA